MAYHLLPANPIPLRDVTPFSGYWLKRCAALFDNKISVGANSVKSAFSLSTVGFVRPLHRTFDLFHRKVASIAILADENPLWRPDHFSYEFWGSRSALWFPCVKLLDYREKWLELEASTHPFASVMMAHLKAVETIRRQRAAIPVAADPH
jgi:hypothetical protein